MKKKIIIVLSIALLLFISSFAYVSLKTKNLEKQMINYVEEKGYSKESLDKLDVNYSFVGALQSSDHGWNISVIYRDEPGVDYSYTVERGEIILSGFSGDFKDKSTLKHLDVSK